MGMEAAIAKVLADNAHSLAKTILKTVSGEGIAVSSNPKNEGEKVAQVTPDGMPKKRTVADTPLPKTIQETSAVGSVPLEAATRKRTRSAREIIRLTLMLVASSDRFLSALVYGNCAR
uniref:Variable large protein n=1 Tax=Ditylenchus dipsaci TaxID=166011 RepID=A0A915DCA0_9BILA